MNRGQASLVMILVVAMAFIFYAVELNWNRLADFKITTWTAANTAASAVASNFASYGERVLQENLLNEDAMDNWDSVTYEDGNIKVCQNTYLWLKILVAIIVLIIVIATYGAGSYLLVIVMAALYAASFVLEYAYITPMQMAMWNKLQQNLQPVDQFKESGIQTGMQALVTDNVSLPDRFDMNGNSAWGFDPAKLGRANDTISRFALFYTERLKLIGKKQKYYAPNTTAATFDAFRNALNGLVYNSAVNPTPGLGYSPYCSGDNVGIITKDLLIQSKLDPVKIFDLLTLNPAASPNKWAQQLSPIRIRMATSLNMFNAATVDLIRAEATLEGISAADFAKLVPIMQQAQARDTSSPLCNPACTHSKGSLQHGYDLGWGSGGSVVTGQKYYVPDECLACANVVNGPNEYRPCPTFSKTVPANPADPVNLNSDNFRLLYSPYLEDPNAFDSTDLSNIGNSFRTRLGHDDEMGKVFGASNVPPEPTYDVKRATGVVFPFLATMDVLKPGHDASNDIYLALNTALTANGLTPGIPPGIPQFPDSVLPITKLTQPTDCAVTNKDLDPRVSIYWKKGSDQYCSDLITNVAYRQKDPDPPNALITEDAYIKKVKDSKGNLRFGDKVFIQGHQNDPVQDPLTQSVVPYHWQYSDCSYMHDAATGQRIPCPQGTAGAQLWPQDRLDSIVYGLPKLYELNEYLRSLSASQLNIGINQWYPRMAQFVAPKCSALGCAKLKASHPGQNCTDEIYAGVAAINASTLAVSLSNQKGNPSDPLDATKPKFMDDPAVCNPQQQGLLIQWWFEMQSWRDILTAWINTATPVAPTDLCSGGTLNTLDPLNTAQCLQRKSLFFMDLESCVKGDPDDLITYPPFPAGAGTALSYSCKKALDKGFAVPANFMTPVPAVARPDATGDYAAAYTTDGGSYPLIKKWIITEWAVQEVINSRAVSLNILSKDGTNAMNLFREGARDFYNFLSVPLPGKDNANTLMQARQKQKATNTVVSTGSFDVKELPGFAVYGWKDDQVRYINNAKDEQGFWHIARMEIKQPETLPDIHAFQESGFLDILNCYEFENGSGDVYTRATRWDENKTSRKSSQFANKKPIWQFDFTSTHSSRIAVSYSSDSCLALSSTDMNAIKLGDPGQNLDTYCANKKIGLTAAMVNALRVSDCNGAKTACVYPLGTAGSRTPEDTAKELKDYNYSFMFNFEPFGKTPQANACWCLVNALLNSGIVSYSGAHFGIPNASPYHVKVNFIDPEDVKDADDGFKDKSLGETVDEIIEKPTP